MRKPTHTSRRPNLNRDLATLFKGGSLAASTDGELLDRFLTSRDERAELAFEALVLRHGPMVWGVCRRILADPTDAEDAFQATFLVLVRKARSVRVDDSLGRWLYGVSRRVATRTRSDRDRRRGRESGGMMPDRPERPHLSPARAETFAELDAEVSRLAEPFRSAIILCDLGGLTHEQAALDLGCPVGTIKSRLSRGRERLRTRLLRRGVDWGVGPVLVGLSSPPASLVGPTIRAGLAMAVGGAGQAVVPLAASGWFSLHKGVCSMMIAFSVPTLAGVALAAALGLTGFVWIDGSADDAPAQAKTSVVRTPSPPASEAGAASTPREFAKVVMPDYVVEPPDIIVVETLEALPGQPITGERTVRPDGKVSLGFYGDVFVAGLTTLEIKAKVIEHLREYLSDAALGLSKTTDGKTIEVPAQRSSRVFVDIAAYNSKVYYIQGQVRTPGRLPVTGNETVLDALTYSGGLAGLTPEQAQIRLVRPASATNRVAQQLRVDLPAIVERGDVATNYQIMPGDRLIVTADPEVIQTKPVPVPDAQPDQEGRLREIERKLDLILQKLEARDKP